jgi:gliding motility-associated-like protein
MTLNLEHRILILIFSFFFSGSVLAQKEGNNWLFGNFARVDFNSGVPVALTDGAMNTEEGCSSVSDNMGNLLFYTNGVKVWNSQHEIMPNGVELLANVSSTQAALIVKKPGLNSIYYIFTTDHQAGSNGFRYSEVDINLEGGLGDVNENKNILILPQTLEKIAAIRKENMIDYWIVTHLWNSDQFYAFELTSDGLNMAPVISSVADSVIGGGSTAQGYLKANIPGDRISMVNGGFLHEVEVFDFDLESGVISNAIILDDFLLDQPYGIEFSPSGDLLYCSVLGEPGTVYQYNLLAGTTEAIKNSKTIIGSRFDYGGAIQLGPDGKIYQVGEYGEYLSIIEDPDALGLDCNYNLEGFYLGGKSSWLGLPNYPNSIYQDPPVSTENVCDGDSTFFTINFPNVDSAYWDFGDPMSGVDNYSYDLEPAHYYNEIGSYVVTLIYYANNESNSYSFPLKIFSYPDIYLGVDSLLCQDEIRTLDATTYQAYYQWQDDSTRPDYIVSEPGTYWVKVVANSCLAGDTIIFDACDPNLIMPSVFSPNGDGLNDRFEPVIFNDVYELHISIFDRWGKLVFENSSLEPGWDGKSKGKNCPEGVYFWTINYNGYLHIENYLKGSVTLVR